jgi:hypothetical protein
VATRMTSSQLHHPDTTVKDTVMDHLLQVQHLHYKLYRKHVTMARLFELSIVLRAWLIVSHCLSK